MATQLSCPLFARSLTLYLTVHIGLFSLPGRQQVFKADISVYTSRNNQSRLFLVRSFSAFSSDIPYICYAIF